MNNKLLFLIVGVIAMVGIAAGGIAAIHPAPDVTKPIERFCYYGTSAGCDEIYVDAVTGEIRFRSVNPEQTPVIDRSATTSEIVSYNAYAQTKEIDAANDSLSADIDGKKWVQKLREWESDAATYYAQWDTLTANQKDTVTKEMLRRQGLTWGGLADLLVILDKGQ